MQNIEYFIPFIAYLFGTVPSAYLIVNIFTKENILKKGTGNAGAMNSYEITGRKEIGILVFTADMLKGFFAVMIARSLAADDIFWAGLAAAAVVLGHNYNIWLKFKGGRGLAAAVGALLQINAAGIIIWGVLWTLTFFIIKRNIHAGNIFATVLTPIAVFAIPSDIILRLNILPLTKDQYFYMMVLLCIIIFLRHIKPMIELMNEKKIT